MHADEFEREDDEKRNKKQCHYSYRSGRKQPTQLVILEDLMDSVWYNFAHSNTQW
jgi:hypothetical protein